MEGNQAAVPRLAQTVDESERREALQSENAKLLAGEGSQPDEWVQVDKKEAPPSIVDQYSKQEDAITHPASPDPVSLLAKNLDEVKIKERLQEDNLKAAEGSRSIEKEEDKDEDKKEKKDKKEKSSEKEEDKDEDKKAKKDKKDKKEKRDKDDDKELTEEEKVAKKAQKEQEKAAKKAEKEKKKAEKESKKKEKEKSFDEEKILKKLEKLQKKEQKLKEKRSYFENLLQERRSDKGEEISQRT